MGLAIDVRPATTLYGIDAATDQLFIQNPPNNGTQVPAGPLGVDTTDEVGFDITANDDVAFATLTVGLATGLYRIDLATGAATLVTALAGGPYIDIAILSRGVPMFALRGGTELVRFHSATPGTVQSTVAISGLQAGRPRRHRPAGRGRTVVWCLGTAAGDPDTGVVDALPPFSPAGPV